MTHLLYRSDHLQDTTDQESETVADVPFMLLSRKETLAGYGVRARVSVAVDTSLGDQASAFFARRRGGPPLLFGAVPFDLCKPSLLTQPAVVLKSARRLDPAFVTPLMALPDAIAPPARRWDMDPRPRADRYASSVAECLSRMARSEGGPEPLRKVVLSRSLVARAPGPINAQRLFQRLARDTSVTTFAMPLPPQGGQIRALVGATPELLIGKTGDQVVSHPLAGSTPRREDTDADRRAADALLRSEKDRREHAAVVEAIHDGLAPYCRRLRVPKTPALTTTASMWHLGSRIVGQLKDPDTPPLDLLAAIHPTPAVCGVPRDQARAMIGALEGYDRAFYAGAVGWCDASGDGRWYLAIRCAEITGDTARLYAGAGIVRGSDPDSETRETSAKFRALLTALGIDEHGASLEGGDE